MEAFVLQDIPFRVDIDRLLNKVHVKAESEYGSRVRQLVEEALAIGRPKAMYKIAYIEAKEDEAVIVDGVRLTSRVLRVNLDQAHRVFPFVATCGRELHDWASDKEDLLEEFWAGAIMEMALNAAYEAVVADLESFQLGTTATMNPGSLQDWPMSEQRQLFTLLGDPREAIGVELTDSFLMVPIKSISGLHFPTEVRFQNCQLCPREGCPGRRAPYDPTLYDRKYRR